ncbi:carboxypeptidase-like regulatory domain-containing protein [Marixanthomonas spongiae]|uniref:Carboxypeptidase regulatory-like domain-containing protein n=1 Tax=Marixanthomonas spongiae TaxID=2174845 RepID=A0A2U0I2Q1_9FLAO|nr:carboxypeptidase-like regulatory domain-containing protein [Marixanthomonas spongiae]PVW15270.1 hypothetical protein DDV96_07660 [Marixanthomonas spongiae]
MKSYIKTTLLITVTTLFIGCSSNNTIFGGNDTSSTANADADSETVHADTATETKKTDGAIMGSVIAPNSEVSIVATNSEEKITGTTNEVGEFFITGFPEGTYTVKIKTEENETTQQTFEDVKVRIGEVTALGTVTVASN